MPIVKVDKEFNHGNGAKKLQVHSNDKVQQPDRQTFQFYKTSLMKQLIFYVTYKLGLRALIYDGYEIILLEIRLIKTTM